MTYDYKNKKIVAVLASNLEMGTATNVIGHLCVSIGAFGVELMGRETLVDKSGVKHIGISKYPLIITKVKPNRLKRLINDSKKYNDLLIVDYPKEMYDTGHDDELAEAVSQKNNEDLEYLGVVLYGNSTDLTELTGKFTLWK